MLRELCKFSGFIAIESKSMQISLAEDARERSDAQIKLMHDAMLSTAWDMQETEEMAALRG